MFIVSLHTSPNRFSKDHTFMLTLGERVTTVFLLPTFLGLFIWIIMFVISLITKKKSKYYEFAAYFTSASFLFSVLFGFLL